MEIRVRTLGTFEVRVHDEQIERWRAGKARNLLQYLLMHRGRVVPRERLVESLWPDSERAATSSSLKVAAHMLRGILTQHAGGEASAALQLVTREPGYVLESRNVWIDFDVLSELIKEGHQAERHGDADRAAERYRTAVGLYQGEFLPGVTYEWAQVYREWSRSRILLTLERLIHLGLQGRDYLGVAGHCHRLIEIEPFCEKAYQALILVHGKLGQVSQARRWYELCVSRLGSGLRMRPHESTSRLFSSAVRGEMVERQLVSR